MNDEQFISLVLLALAVFLFFRYQQLRHKLAVMADTPSFTVAELEEARQHPVLASGSAFPFLAEINGAVECAQPLTGQLSGEPCAAFHALVQREWDEQREVRSNDGSVRTETATHTDTVSDLHRETRFVVRDGSGAIEVDPDGSSLDMPQVFDRFETADNGAVQVQLGAFSFNVGAGFGMGGSRTRGYRAKEWALLPGQRVYVLGEVQEQGERLTVARPTAAGSLYIISTKSEKELASSARTGGWAALAGAVALLAVAVGLALHSLLGRL